MPRGPLPDPHAVRRNKAEIPATELPISGRKGPIPKVPGWIRPLGKAGMAWWRWAWRTPEACGWSESLVDVVGRRASLVDDLWALEAIEGLDAAGIIEAELPAEVKTLIRRLAGFAANRIAVVKAIEDLDQQLGFGAKNLAALRWKIIDDRQPASSSAAPEPEQSGARSRMRLVASGG